MIAGAPQRPTRVLVVGDDAEVSASLCLQLPRGGYAPVCLPDPDLLEPVMPLVAPYAVVLVLPSTPTTAWGPALTAVASAAQQGVRVVLVGPARDVIQPLAAVAGAERALSRAEVLARPLSVLEGVTFRLGPPPLPPRPAPTPVPARAAPPSREPAAPYPQPSARARTPTPVPIARIQPVPAPPIDLLALIDEELVDDPSRRVPLTRIELNVTLVSEHNFYVGRSRRIDSGGVFISTMLPPAVGTRLEIRLGLPDARKVDVQGEVAFVRDRDATGGRQPAGCGVRLQAIPTWVADEIDRFLAARPPIVWAP